MEEIIQKLIEKDYTIATMESCTGGGIANAITNIERASEVLKFSAVTYSNEYKIKMGVNEQVINKYSVYSMETAHEMALNISKFAQADLGVGITGKLNRVDKINPFGKDNIVFVSIYDKTNDKYYDITLEAKLASRKENKEFVLENIVTLLNKIL